MNDIEKIIEEIDWKVRKIVSDRDALRKELEKKNKEIESLQSQVEELVNTNKELKENIQINNLTNTINKRSDISGSKEIINDLLRKINRSISIITQGNE